MRLSDVLNPDRVRAMNTDPNAYVMKEQPKQQTDTVKAQEVEKVLFPEPYENARAYHNHDQFSKPPPPSQPKPAPSENHPHQNKPMFDMQSLLPMLMSGKFNDMLKPLMSMFGGGGNSGGGLGDITKIFELFKPKSNTKKAEPKEEEDMSSKFDDMIIIED